MSLFGQHKVSQEVWCELFKCMLAQRGSLCRVFVVLLIPKGQTDQVKTCTKVVLYGVFFFFCCFSECWIFGRLHPQRSSDWLQAHGHPNSATSDCYQEVHSQASGSRRSLIHPTFLCQPGGQASKPHGSAACSCLLCHSINPKPAHLQCPGEVGPAWPPASSSGWASFRPTANPQSRTGAVHACPAQRS